MKNIHNILDFKNDNGLWVKSKTVGGVTYHTRASVLWNNIKKRSNPRGVYKTQNKGYTNTDNNFIDFQDLADWCQDQIGYSNKDLNGSFWCLDKDMLGNGTYSKEGCVFIPHKINVIFTNNAKTKDLPLGVSLDKTSIRARLSVEGKVRSLGTFSDTTKAHRAWQQGKIKCVESSLNKWEGLVDGRVITRLQDVLLKLQEDVDNGRETVKI